MLDILSSAGVIVGICLMAIPVGFVWMIFCDKAERRATKEISRRLGQRPQL